MKKCMVVLSGGQDSTICLFWAKQHYDEVHAITFDYDQRHRIELKSAERVAEMAGVRSHRMITIGAILDGKSPLTNKHEKLETYSDFDSMDKIIGDRIETTFVPMRNALFLVLAANRAHYMDIPTLVTGVCQADGANYPDCRESFICAMEVAVEKALGARRFRIEAPLLNLTKSESVHFAMHLPGCYEALAHTHTAYDGQYPPAGKDHASTLRAHGFEEAGVPDPLVVRAALEGLMPLPNSANFDVVRDLVKGFLSFNAGGTVDNQKAHVNGCIRRIAEIVVAR